MIDTKALRSRILDLAIQGKLTEQLPSDGTAEELYQQIQAEKQTNGKIGHNSKAAVFKGDDGYFYHHIQNGESVYTIKLDLPKNWIACTISDISYLISSKDHQIQTKDINESGLYPVISQGKEEIDGYCDIDEKVICEVPILLFGDHTRNVKLIATPFVVGADGTKLHRIIGADIKYVFYWMIHAANAIESKGYARHYSLLQRQCLFLPPLAEQKRIVERVEEIFRLLDTIDQAQEKYSADSQILKAKLITAGIQGKLTEQLESDGTAHELYQQIQAEKQKLIKEGKIKKEKPLPPVSPEEVPFEIPENWRWVRLGEVYSFNPKVEADDSSKAAFIPMERISAGYSRDFSFEVQDWKQASNNHTKFSDGDVAFAKITPCFENRKSFIAQDLPNSIGGGTTELIILRQKLIFPIYTYLLIIDQRFIDAGVASYKGTAGQQRVKKEAIMNYMIPLPPLAEQKRIADVLERALGVIE